MAALIRQLALVSESKIVPHGDVLKVSAALHSTKSLRDSPLRGAGELIKLNPLAPSKATSARSLTWD